MNGELASASGRPRHTELTDDQRQRTTPSPAHLARHADAAGRGTSVSSFALALTYCDRDCSVAFGDFDGEALGSMNLPRN
jgi:hypothetical protein